MAKIRILPEQLANQIAAGEVVERPASVVKELLENSLDAGADRIEIEVEGGGTRLIRIIDNGEGMDEDDVLMSLERHGTSKIAQDRDLAAISTLGFRGEAIPSIASVSQMTITSRPIGAALGTQVVVAYGKLLKIHESGTGCGSQFEVRNLFGNTPARRKFLRTDRTEIGHIEEIVQSYALGSAEVAFILRVDGKEVLHLDRTLSLDNRLARIMSYRGSLIKIGTLLPPLGRQGVYGFLIPPEETVSASARLRLFVNGRAIRDRMMGHAVIEGLRSFLMKGRNPAGLIHLFIPAAEVDVNVHPAKHEVRFRNSRDIHLLISQAVSEAMGNYQQQLQTTLFSRVRTVETTPIPLDTTGGFASPASNREVSGEEENRPYRTALDAQGKPAQNPLPDAPASGTVPNTPLAKGSFSLAVHEALPPAHQPQPALETTGQTSLADTRHLQHSLQVIGQFDNLYILCQNSEGLVVIDQHAAHERLLFEDLRRQYCRGRIASQHLLFPETVELTLFQAQLVEKNLEELAKMGFALRHFGGNTYIISAIPALAGQCAAGELLLDMLEQFGNENGARPRDNRFDSILASMACRAAVKSGVSLTTEEIEALLARMAKEELFSHCPHGRPVWKIFSRTEVKKWFHRS